MRNAVLLAAVLLAGCAARDDQIAGYTCALPEQVRAARAAVAAGTASEHEKAIAAQPCTPYTVAEQRARQEQLDSCHILSGCGGE